MDTTTEIGNISETTINYLRESKKTALCFIIPFCDVSDCDRLKYYNPLDCPRCNVTIVGVYFIVLVLLALFIVLGNMGIILVILRNRIFHNSFNMFKCSLAVADLLVGVLVLPSGAFMLLYHLSVPFDKELAKLNETYADSQGQTFKRGSFCDRIHQEDDTPSGKFFSIISVLSIMGRALNIRSAAILIMVVWVTCTILSAVVPIGLGTKHFSYGLSPPMIFTLKTPNPNTGLIYAALALGLPFFVLCGLNLATGMIILKKRGKIKRRTSNANNSNNNPRRSNEVKATITLLVMVLVFTLTTVPAYIGVTFYNGSQMDTGSNSIYLHGVMYCILIPLIVSNSAWNFIIYSWRNNNFRRALKELLHCTRNGKRRHFRWKKVKRVALRHSEKKRRRKRLVKLTESFNSSENSKQNGGVADNSFRTTSVRSIDSMVRKNHRSLHYKASVTSSISNSSLTNYTSASYLPTQQNSGEHCHSPMIPEEDDDIFFGESKTGNGAIQDTEKTNEKMLSGVENGTKPTLINNNDTILENGISSKKPLSPNHECENGSSTVGNGTVNNAYDDCSEIDETSQGS